MTKHTAGAADSLPAAELESREAHKRERLMRRARFPQAKSFEGYDCSQVAFPGGYGPAGLESLAFLDAAEGVALHGRTGRGRTRLATAMGVRAVSLGRPARFHSTARLVMRLERAQREGKPGAALRDATNADLVILDGFGHVPIGVAGALPFQAAGDRHERRGLVVATNIELSRWGTVLGDGKLAAAMIGRVVHHSRLVESGGTGHRMDGAPMLAGADR